MAPIAPPNTVAPLVLTVSARVPAASPLAVLANVIALPPVDDAVTSPASVAASLYVCAPLVVIDGAAANGGAIPVEQATAAGLTRIGATAVVPAETAVLNPACDVTPHDLVTAIVTEEGVLRAPLGPAIADARERRSTRLEHLADARATLVRSEPG